MSDSPKRPRRSRQWFGLEGKQGFYYRSWLKGLGTPHDQFDGRPVIGICNTWSELTPCNSSFRDLAEHVKHGVYEAGGFPLEFPVMSLGETQMRPTAMLFRNLASMDVEESIRANPLDGVVLLMGCDKTTPSLLMGAASVDLPTIGVSGGPSLSGNWRGKPVGSGTGVIEMSEMVRAGTLSQAEFTEAEACMQRSRGSCMTMGTASTMTAIAEAIGMTLPGASAIPAADANHKRMSAAVGRRIVDMVWEDLKPTDVLTREAFENGITVAMAMGCSTNAIIHVIAMARRAGIDISLADFDKASRVVPVIANVRPSGDKYLMEDFFYAGGLPALMTRLTDHLHLGAITVTGRPIADNLIGAEVHNDDVIRTVQNPIYAEGALAVLKGNLSPDGCVIKPSACEPRFLKHTGPALVFDDYPSMKAAIDRDDLDVTADTVLVLRNAGPHGGPGMPEWGMLPIPKKLVKQGIRDMVRISDARMSGTSYGACILHVSPEAHIGGPLALLQTGDLIELDVDARTLNMKVSDEELARRRAAWQPPKAHYERGYGWIFTKHIKQAHEGCDFDFLEESFGGPVAEPVIF